MSITNLCTATSDALTHNGRTTVSLINAYRAGGTRLLGLVDNGWAQLVNRGGSRLSEQRRQNLVAIEQQLSGYYQKGLDVLSTQSTRAVNAVVDATANGIDKLGQQGERLETKLSPLPVNRMVTLVQPLAETSRDWAGFVADRAESLVARLDSQDKKPAAADEAVTPAATATVAEGAQAQPA